MDNKKKMIDRLMFIGGLGIGVFIAAWPKVVVRIVNGMEKEL